MKESTNKGKGARKMMARLLIALTLGAFFSCAPSTPATKEIVSETTDIKGGSWKAYTFNAPEKLRLAVSAKVIRGPAIDLITMTEEGYLAWKNAQTKILGGGEYYFYPELSSKSIRSVSKTGILGPNKYVVVVYNPEWKLLIENEATVEVKITAQLAR